MLDGRVNKNILIVTKTFFPTNSPRANRATELAKEFSRLGHNVTVLTSSAPEQIELTKEFGIQCVDLGALSWRSINTPSRGILGFIKRAVRRIGVTFVCYPDIEVTYRIWRKLPGIKEHDLLISIAAPHAVHWGVALSNRSKIVPAERWVADCGDPFMRQENDSFSPAFYFEWLERRFCSMARWITIPTEGARDGYFPEYANKLLVIPQGFKFEDYEHLRDILPVPDRILRFAFAGAFIRGRRDPSKFLQYLSHRNGEFEFHVFTKDASLVRPFADRDSRIVIHKHTPRDVLLERLAEMDFLVNFENAGVRQTPSKLIDYWLCGRPILSVGSIEFDRDIVDEFLQGDFKNCHKVEDPDQYEIGNVAKKFLGLAG